MQETCIFLDFTFAFSFLQGVTKLKNFDIKIAAGGVDKEVNITLKGIRVTNKTLEVRFQYAGKGTTAVPLRGAYGPLISAISMVAGMLILHIF